LSAEAHIAIDPENAAQRITGKRYPHVAERRPDGDDQRAKRRQHLGLVHRFARLEPGRIVVAAQPAEKRECRRAKPGEAVWSGCHRPLRA
jgi:hypothetical protein